MSSGQVFSVTLLLTASAALWGWLLRRSRRNRLRKLAAQWRMNYSPRDPFRLTARVARNFPVPGAAKIRVVDLIYGIDNDMYRYVFTAEYTTGVVSGKRRVLRAGAFSEPRVRNLDAAQSPITLAPVHLRLMDQYEKLSPMPGA